MKTVVYLDMDGTIANLYGIENWLGRLRNEDSTIFTECETLISETALFELYPVEKYEIRILSMTPKNGLILISRILKSEFIYLMGIIRI